PQEEGGPVDRDRTHGRQDAVHRPLAVVDLRALAGEDEGDPHDRTEGHDERDQGEQALGEVALCARDEGLDDDAETGGREDDDQRRQLRVVDRGLDELVHWSAPSAIVVSCSVPTTSGGSSLTPTWVRMSSTAGLITSRTGCGKKPNTTSSTSSGATAPISRLSRSVTAPYSGRTGPVIVRW